MMRDTPRIFVGTVSLRLQTGDCRHVAPAAQSLVTKQGELMPGVRVCDVDVENRIVLVTADRPTDRSDVVDALGQLGCHVLD
jgi:hypothetical protein